jgi:hypothetical protein
MKRRIRKHVAAMAFLLASTLAANALDCLPDPDPACVFQMALLQADADPMPERQVLGYLTVAYLQKASGHGDPEFTMTVLGSKLLRRNLTPEDINRAFTFGTLGYALLPGWGPSDTDARVWIVGATEGLIRQINPTQISEARPDFNAPAAAEKAAMRVRVAAAASDAIAKYARLTAAGIPAHNRDFSLLGFGLSGLSDLQTDELESLVQKLAFQAAGRVIASWPEKADRAVGYAYLAVHLARAGEIRPALVLSTERPELQDLELLPDGSIWELAETWARAGWGGKTDALLGHMEHDISRRLPQIRAIAAAVTSDFARAASQVQSIEDIKDRSYTVSAAMGAYLTSGQTRSEDFVAALPPELRPSAILGIGIYQAQTGDLDGALATHDRLRAMAATDLPFDLRAELAPLLAAMGRVDEAVLMAQEAGQAWITAEVARQIK